MILTKHTHTHTRRIQTHKKKGSEKGPHAKQVALSQVSAMAPTKVRMCEYTNACVSVPITRRDVSRHCVWLTSQPCS